MKWNQLNVLTIMLLNYYTKPCKKYEQQTVGNKCNIIYIKSTRMRAQMQCA